MAAPICRIAPDTTVDQPDPVLLPTIPVPAPNWDAMMATVSALKHTVEQLAGQRPVQNGGSNKSGNKGNKKNQTNRFNEINRVTTQVRVYNPNDKSQYVDIDQINQLTLQDKVTGETWGWNR